MLTFCNELLSRVSLASMLGEQKEQKHQKPLIVVPLHNAPVMAGDKSAGDGICQGMLVTQGDFCEC